MLRNLIRILLTVTLTMAGATAACAKEKETDPYKGYDEAVFMDMELEDNLLTPAVGKTGHNAVKNHINRLARNLAKQNYIVDLLRDDEVMLVTLPTDKLFLPNDTLLSQQAPGLLQPLLKLAADPEMFKVIYVVHTDNTGSHTYNMWLSHERNSSIYEFMLRQIDDRLIVIPYEMGDTDPLESNETRAGRAENRRLEIYFVPGPKMITLARKGQLK